MFEFHGTKQELLQKLNALPGVLSGQIKDNSGISRSQGIRLANSFLFHVQQSFMQKSVPGGKGDDNIQWERHAAATIASRTRKEKKSSKIKEAFQAWRKLASELKAKFGLPDAKATALAKARFPILYEHGDLHNSFTPGKGDTPSGVSEQVIDVRPGEVSVKITTENKWRHHTGWTHRNGKKVPARKFWPTEGRLPPLYWSTMLRSYGEGLSQKLSDYLAV